MSDTIIVTRHPGMVQYLLSIGLIEEGTPVLSHVSRKNQIKNKNVIGVLPLYLACQASSITEIPLPKLPVELRGKELTFEQSQRIRRGTATIHGNKVGGLKCQRPITFTSIGDWNLEPERFTTIAFGVHTCFQLKGWKVSNLFVGNVRNHSRSQRKLFVIKRNQSVRFVLPLLH